MCYGKNLKNFTGKTAKKLSHCKEYTQFPQYTGIGCTFKFLKEF